jgi:hypothetical protein
MANETERRLFNNMRRVKQYPADLRDTTAYTDTAAHDQKQLNALLERAKQVLGSEEAKALTQSKARLSIFPS